MNPPTQTPGQQRAKRTLRLIAMELCRRLLHFSSEPLEEAEGPTVIIAPHQDDETLACGALIARRRNEGLPLHVVFITDSSASHPGHTRLTPSEMTRLRREEAMKALWFLGVERDSIHFLDEPDGTLKNIEPRRRQRLVTALAGLLEGIHPQEVFLPCCPDGSSEHDAVFQFVLEAAEQARLRPTLWQYPVWAWWNPRLLIGLWWRTKDCRRLPAEDHLQAKRNAIGCYASQTNPLPPDESAALPPDLVDIFRSDSEYYLRYAWPRRKP